MKLRFRVRTLLIVTAVVAIFFGLQIHVHNKSKRFVEDVRRSSVPDTRVEAAFVMPLSVTDVLCFQRRCAFQVETTERLTTGGKIVIQQTVNYRVQCLGEIKIEEGSVIPTGRQR